MTQVCLLSVSDAGIEQHHAFSDDRRAWHYLAGWVMQNWDLARHGQDRGRGEHREVLRRRDRRILLQHHDVRDRPGAGGLISRTLLADHQQGEFWNLGVARRQPTSKVDFDEHFLRNA
jgi:hypothetical protein